MFLLLLIGINPDLHVPELQRRPRTQEAVLEYFMEMSSANYFWGIVAQIEEMLENTTGKSSAICNDGIIVGSFSGSMKYTHHLTPSLYRTHQ